MSALKIAIAGVNGHMGRILVEAVNNHPDTVLSGALEHSGSEVLGLDAGFASGIKTGIAISDDVDAVLAQSDVLIDFTQLRSEERRVGKECRSRWSPYH